VKLSKAVRKTTAVTITAAAASVSVTGIGAAIRGPDAEGIGRDFLTGAGIVAAMVAIQWAASELGAGGEAR
jgi:hypothetical protein